MLGIVYQRARKLVIPLGGFRVVPHGPVEGEKLSLTIRSVTICPFVHFPGLSEQFVAVDETVQTKLDKNNVEAVREVV